MDLARLRSTLRRFEHRLPRRSLSLLASIDLRLQCLEADRNDRRRLGAAGLVGIPSAWLRYSVAGSTDIDRYVSVGKRCSEDLLAGLKRAGISMNNAGRVLDFGCGCGRTLRFLGEYSPPTRFHGTDVHRAAIAWCRRHLPFAEYKWNRPLPPIAYPDSTFDVVYSISVLTHLDEGYQLAWLDELRRVLRPGGSVLVTVHGETALATLPPEIIKEVDLSRTGFAFLANDSWKGMFPRWYQSSFQTREHVMRVFSRGLEVFDYVEAGMGGKQDLVLMRRPNA